LLTKNQFTIICFRRTHNCRGWAG